MHCAAPAEAAAEVQLVDLALRRLEAGGFGRGGSAASPFCVGVQTSQRSGVPAADSVIFAVAFIVSIVAWFWCG